MTPMKPMNDTLKKMVKVAIYIRVSTDEQKDHGLSVAAQLQALRKYCEENGYEIYEEYIDEGISAGAMKKRKAMQRLLQDCRDGKVNMILFTKLDRWFRHVSKYHAIQDELNALNVSWLAIHEPNYETVTAMGRMNINFYLAMAQGEIDRTSERVNAVIQYKVSQGHALTGSLPLGYKIGDDKKPVFDNDTAPIAKFILTEFENIGGIRKLQRVVNEKFEVEITYAVVSKTLKNKKYTGLYRGNPDYFPPMITLAQFDHNQELILKNVRERAAAHGHCRTYIFSGLLKCAICGRRMGGSVCGQNVKSYRCPLHQKNKSCENRKRTAEKTLEKILLARIKEELTELKFQAEQTPIEEVPEIDVDAIKEEQKRLNMMFMKGRIDEETYEAEYERIDKLLSQAVVSKPKAETDLVFTADFEETYWTFTDEEKRQFWRGLVSHVDVIGRDVTIHFLA